MTPSALESALARLRKIAEDKHGAVMGGIVSPADARALLARLDALEWQPIETAPKDGTWFLAWRAHATRPRIVRWDAMTGAESEFGEHVYHLERWMPLPAYRAPQPAGGGE